MSIRTRLFVLILFATLIPVLIAGTQFLQRRDLEIASAREDVAASARRIAEDLEDVVNGTAQLHFGLSRARDLDTQDRAACSAFLADVLKEHPQYTGILTITPQGDLFCDSLRTGRNLHLTDRRYFQDVLRAGHPLGVEPVFGRLTGIAVLQIAYAARAPAGDLKFVLLASLNLEQYMQPRSELPLRGNAVTALVDNKGTILTWHPGGEKLRGTSIADTPLFRFVRGQDGRDMQADIEVGGVSRIWAVSPLPGFPEAGLQVLVGVSKTDLLAPANRQLVQALATLAIATLLALAAAWALVEWSIRRQTARTIAAVTRFSGGDFAARIGKPYPRGELGNLMTALDRAFDLMQEQREKIKRLTRVHAVLSGINGLIVRVADRDELFRDACRILVEVGEFRFAWLGLVDEEAGRVNPVAWEGIGTDYLHAIPLGLSEAVPEQYGLSGRALGSRSPAISNDIAQDPSFLLKQAALDRGIHSAAVLPLIVSDKAIGVMALYAGEAGYFDDEEMALLIELAGDISFALDHIEKGKQVAYLAYYDPVTGLANRTLFNERLKQQLAIAAREQRKLGLAVLDVERFKEINDALGWQAGDALLKQIANRMTREAPDLAWIGRVGADHFAIMAPDLQNPDDLGRLVEHRIDACFAAPFLVGTTELRIAAKVGIAAYPADGAVAGILFRNAEAALKQAKAEGERRLFYAHSMNERVAEKMALESKLRQALDNGEFVLHYQPKVSLATGRIAGMEALIRWQSRELGLVPPMQFIPLMEETGLILPVGIWALEQASRDHRSLASRLAEAPRIAVNVSSIQLRQRDFVDVVARAVGADIAPPGIDIEITESHIMGDLHGGIEKLRRIRALGVNLAIDDFGTGYSSLRYLAQLPVQTLKIDRSFIITMLKEPDTMTLVRTVISMAHSLKLTVVAEGVDAEEQAAMLRLLRCDEMQGYLYSRPLPLDQLTTLLTAGTDGQDPPVAGRPDQI